MRRLGSIRRQGRGEAIVAGARRQTVVWAFLCLLGPPASGETCEPPMAKVFKAQGQVDLSQGGAPRWQRVGLEQSLCPGDRLRLGRRSRATVRFANQTLIDLDEGSTLVLHDAAKPEEIGLLELLRGALHAISRVPRQLDIRTPIANAGVEGTEFALRVDPDRAELWVYEGRVLFENAQGQLRVGGGEAALARAGEAPERRIVVKPRQAVEWALYYPPLLDSRPESYPEALRPAILAYRRNDFTAAFAALDGVPEGARDARYHTLRAGLLLSVGRVPEAEGDLRSAERLDPKNGTAYALRSVIAVVRNEGEEALKLAADAVRLAPGSATPHVARSYAEQSAFEIEKAHESLEKAADLAPEDALVWARLAEIELSRGDLDAALEAATKAETLDPGLARTQTVLGFAYLTRVEVDEARAAFDRAIARDPADPLPRLGLGLAKIRDGDLDAGTEEIEIAASLDPNNSLVRSYLGKAYYEQKRGGLAETEFEQAKLLDPKDPTPWFYDAIQKQTTNRPVEALRDLQKAIELNDNRAVYRSKLLLDQDLAARGAALGRIYQELGFEQSALIEGWTSLTRDPSDYTAHRLLADTYAALPRHEIARVSELLQSQLLQPTNITPVQPQLAESDLFLLGGVGPADPSLNEFNSLFLRNRLSLLASGLLGSQDIYGDEIVHSGIWNRLSYSLGQFHYESGGFRDNNDLDTNIYTAYAQYELSPNASVQLELRRQGTEAGDLREFSNPDFVFEDLRQSFDRDTARFGFRFSPDPSSDVIASFAYRELNRDTNDPNFRPTGDFLLGLFDAEELSPEDIAFVTSLAPLFPAGFNEIIRTTNDINSATFELEYLKRWERLNIVLGGGFTDQDRTTTVFTAAPLSSPLDPNLREDLEARGFSAEDASDIITRVNRFTTSDLEAEDSDESHLDAYLYGTLQLSDKLALITGVSVNAIDRDSDDGNIQQSAALDRTRAYVSPKVGAVWKPTPSTRLRAAWFRAVSFASGQTIEPTHVAGFNQLFDDAGGARFQRYGVGIDQKLPQHFNAGFEFTWRDLEAPRFEFGDMPTASLINQEETAHRAYLYWTPTTRVTLAAQYFYEELERGPLISLASGIPRSAVLHQAPLSLGYYDPNGFSARLTATYVNQDVEVRDDDPIPLGTSDASDRFWSTDVFIGYRLPKRLGILTFGVVNLFNEELRFQDATPNVVGDLEGELVPPVFVPERAVFGKITVAF